MSSLTTVVSVVGPDHTVKAPPGVDVGARVLVMPMPSMSDLLRDSARRARFAATHRTIREALLVSFDTEHLSDEATESSKECVSIPYSYQSNATMAQENKQL